MPGQEGPGCKMVGHGGAVSPQNSADLLPGHTAEKRGKREKEAKPSAHSQGGFLSSQPCFSSDLPLVSGGSSPALGALPLAECFSVFPERNRKA